MLNARTNMVFDPNVLIYLKRLAKREKSSVGKLVRKAVEEKYLSQQKKRDKQIAEAAHKILKIRKIIKGINYNELINYGRKY